MRILGDARPARAGARWACAAAAALALALAACGGDDDNDSGTTESAAAAKAVDPAAARNAKGTVAWCIGKDVTGTFRTGIRRFEAANPGVRVNLIELPEEADEQRNQQVQRLRAKSPECDVLGLDVIWTAEYAQQGWLQDMSKVVADRRSEFIPSTLDTARFDGRHWAMPFRSNAAFLYYRTDHVSDPPATWQEAYQRAGDEKGIVFQGAAYEGLTVDFLELLFSAGGRVLSDDGKKVEIDGQPARDVLKLMADGVRSGAVPRTVTTYKEEEARRAFEAGRASLMRNWPYAYALAKRSDVKDRFAVTPLPAFEGGRPAGVLGGYNLAISAYSKNPGASLAFINFLTTPDWQETMMVEGAAPGTVAAAYDRPAVKKAMPFAGELREAIQQARPRPVSPVYPQISEAIYENVNDVLTGGASPDDAVGKMADEIDKALQTF